MSHVIVDYGMGNLRSLQHKLQRIGVEASISDKPSEIAAATTLFLPGVGYFAEGMANLRQRGLIDVLNESVLGRGTPILGICLGMQLLTSWSEEGDVAGLGWIPAKTVRFRFEGAQSALKIPHMGWNLIERRGGSGLYKYVPEAQRFYFVHSYRVCPEDEAHAASWTTYGIPFVSSIRRDHIVGVQFHPEKSHLAGMRVIENFLATC